MAVNSSTTTIGRLPSPARDHTAARRVYLDTYAKRRNQSQQNQEPAQNKLAQPVVSAAKPASIPYQAAAVEPIVAAAPKLKPNPALFSDIWQVPASVKAETAKEQNNYLDTLIRSYHEPAVSDFAPDEVATETVLETDSTIKNEAELGKKLEANLRALYDDTFTNELAYANTSSASHIRTIVASGLACGVIALGMFTFLGRIDSQPVVAQPIGSTVIEVEAPAAQPYTGASVSTPSQPAVLPVEAAQPVRLVMSSIGVNAKVENVATTTDGLIAVPRAYGLVGWYNKSSLPGKPGPAVLVGHYTGGSGGVFDKLANLSQGDLITTTNGKGENVTYKVTKKAEYERDKVPLQELFKSSDSSRLEIITCAGKWQANTYNKRLVVTAEIVK